MILRVIGAVVAIAAVLIYAITQGGTYHSPQCTLFGVRCPKKVVVTGTTAPKYSKFKKVYQELFDKGEDVASCVAVFEENELVIDLCGGYADGPQGVKPYREGLQNVMSSSKPVVGIVFALLVDRGLIEYEKPIAHYWPDFAQNGKENVTVADLLQHAGGLTWLDPLLPFELITDENRLDELATFLAKQRHNFNSKRTTAYHMLSGGFYLNELVRRVDPKRRTVNQFLQEEINSQLQTEFTFGLPENLENRFSSFIEFPIVKLFVNYVPRIMFNIPFLPPFPEREVMQNGMNQSSLVWKSAKFLEKEPEGFADSRYYRNTSTIVSGNGFTNAISMAKIGHIMAQEGKPTFGIQFFKNPAVARTANTFACNEFDLVMFKNISRTVGGFGEMYTGKPDVLGWAGYGGSLNVWNPVKQYSFAYVPKAKGFELVPKTFGVDKRAGLLFDAFVSLVE